MLHPLCQQFLAGVHAFRIGVSRKFGEPDVAGGVIDHEEGVDAVNRNLSSLDLEEDFFLASSHGDVDLGPGRAFHPSDHAVLREFHAGDHFVIDLQDPVSFSESCFFGGPSRNHLKHDCRVVRYIELDTDTVEIASQFGFGILQLHWRHVHRMRIQFRQRCHYRCLADCLGVDCVHVVPADLVHDKFQLAPVSVSDFQAVPPLGVGIEGERSEHAYHDSENGNQQRVQFLHPLVNLFNFYSCSSEEVNTVSQAVLIFVDNSLYSGLDDQLRTLDARRGRHIERGSEAAVARFGDFGDGVGFGMEDVRLGRTGLVLTLVFKSGRSAIVAVGDDHPVLDEDGAYLSALAIGVASPDFSHLQVSLVEFFHYFDLW